MKWILVLELLFMAACDSTITNPVAPLDTPFWLNHGEHRILVPNNVTIRFLQVLKDSRCPIKYRCELPGSAEIRLQMSTRKSASTLVKVSIPGHIAQAHTYYHLPVDTLGYQITLLQLDPYREASEPIQPSEYKALIQISRTR